MKFYIEINFNNCKSIVIYKYVYNKGLVFSNDHH